LPWPPGSLEELADEKKRILVYGAGGGGDALGAVHLYLRLRRLGADPLLGAVAWERHPIDPFPGPIPIEVLLNAEPLGWTSALVNGETVAYRYGLEVKPQIARVAGALGVEALYIDLSKGAEGVAQALRDAADKLGIEAVIALDTGGDMLAHGCEDNLWSPLADAVSLAGLASSGLPGLVAIHGPGADGELPQDQVLRYIAMLARRQALIDITGLSARDAHTLTRIMGEVVSEASKIPVEAFQGYYGEKAIRAGTRRVRVTPCTATTYILEARKVYEWSPMAQAVAGTRGIGQARERLNQMCIVTELDLELELNRLRERTSHQPYTLDELRHRLRQNLMRRGCRAVECPQG